MLFGPNIHPERQKLRLIQLISQDTPLPPTKMGSGFVFFCGMSRTAPSRGKFFWSRRRIRPWHS